MQDKASWGRPAGQQYEWLLDFLVLFWQACMGRTAAIRAGSMTSLTTRARSLAMAPVARLHRRLVVVAACHLSRSPARWKTAGFHEPRSGASTIPADMRPWGSQSLRGGLGRRGAPACGESGPTSW